MNLKCLFGFHTYELKAENEYFELLPNHMAGDPGSMNVRVFICKRCDYRKTITKRWHEEKPCKKCGVITKHENTIVGELGSYCGQGDGIQRSKCILCGKNS